MSRSPSTESSTSLELATLSAIRDRYGLAGPHATAVVHVPLPGTVGDDLDVRWHATEAMLLHLGASLRSVAHLNDLLRSTHLRGHSLLVTANDDGAAGCWLGFDVEDSAHVGQLPALLPAVHQAASSHASLVGAVIDRTGADIHRIGAFDRDFIGAVEGETEHIHKSSAGNSTHPRHHRHSEVVWERNAALIATRIAEEAARLSASGAVLTGDDREVQLVEEQLASGGVGSVGRVQAGGRHETMTPERLHRAGCEFRDELHRAHVARSLDDLREELGQQDQGLEGSVEVLEAITENRVKTLFVDLSVGAREPHIDAIIRAALAHGADIVTGHEFGVHDGVAAILRMAYA